MKHLSIIPVLLLLGFFILTLQQQSCRQAQQNAAQRTGEFEFLDRLSDYGFFKGELRELQPEEGVIRYELSTPLFSDYTLKDRFIVLPKGQAISYTAQGALDFPDSTIIIKNFAYTDVKQQKIMIETRLLVKDPYDHNWKVMNYLWDNEQIDAVRHIRGAKLPITLVDDKGAQHRTTYMVPNTNDCKRCHINNATLTPIGPKARNLNFTPTGETHNQLEKWSTSGLLKGLPDMKEVPLLPIWTDVANYSLEQRAKAYLDINCAHCHTQGGDAYNTGLFLDYEETTPSRLGFHKPPVSAGGGAGGLDFDIVPGDAEQSILYYRMNSTEAGTAMPELARSLIHVEGVALIQEWINNLPKDK